jgi:hypothetical protein
MLDIVEESYKKLMNKYANEFFAANLDHERIVLLNISYRILILDKKYELP